MYGPQHKVNVSQATKKAGTARMFITQTFRIVQKPAAMIALSPMNQAQAKPTVLQVSLEIETVSQETSNGNAAKALLQHAFQSKQLVAEGKSLTEFTVELLNFLVTYFVTSDINLQIINDEEGDGVTMYYEKPAK